MLSWHIAQIDGFILAVPASSAASEKTFSCAGYVIQESTQTINRGWGAFFVEQSKAAHQTPDSIIPSGAGRASTYSGSARVRNVICATVKNRVGCGFKYGGYGLQNKTCAGLWPTAREVNLHLYIGFMDLDLFFCVIWRLLLIPCWFVNVKPYVLMEINNL